MLVFLCIFSWKKGWHTIMGKVYASYMPIPLDSWDYHPNSFTAIFSDQYCGCYYSFVWSQVCKIVNFYDIEPCAIGCLQDLSSFQRELPSK